MRTFKAEWVRRAESERASYVQFAQTDPFALWERSRMPDLEVNLFLEPALHVLYADMEDLALPLLRKAREIAARIVEEKKCEWEQCKQGYPLNLALVLRAKAYAEALTTGDLSSHDLLEAGKLLGQWTKEEADWKEPQAQAYLLGAIRLELIAGATQEAGQRLSKHAKRLSWFQDQARVLRLTCDVSGRSASARELSEFVAFFDVVRDPAYNRSPAGGYLFEEIDIQRLEFGLLYHHYFKARGHPLSISSVLADVAS